MNLLEFRLPDVGEGIAEAEIVTWHVEVGGEVHRDQPLAELETDKSLVDIPAPCDGVLREQGAAPGTVLPVGAVLAVIAPAGPTEDTGDAEDGHEPTSNDTPPAERSRPDAPHRRPLAAPSTRKLASRLGVDLTTIDGSGPAGRITAQDVQRAADGDVEGSAVSPEPVPAPAPEAASPHVSTRPKATDRVVALQGVRRQIARSMTVSAQIPTIYEWREVDATGLLDAVGSLRAHVEPDGPRIGLLTLVAAAIPVAAAAHPTMNATLDMERDELTLHARCNLGVATATEDGLLVPVVHDVGSRSLTGLAHAIDDLTSRARQRRVSPDELHGGSITVSNYGTFGATYGTPLLRPPEVAIVGVGRVSDQVVAVDGHAVVRPTLPLAVATDHRVNDGEQLARFCTTLVEFLTNPLLLLAGR